MLVCYNSLKISFGRNISLRMLISFENYETMHLGEFNDCNYATKHLKEFTAEQKVYYTCRTFGSLNVPKTVLPNS